MAENVNLFDLAAKISADTKGVDSNLTATQKKVLDLAKEFDKTEQAAKRALGKTSQSVRSLSSDVQKQSTATKGLGQSVNQALTGTASGAASAGVALASMTAAVAGIGVAIGAVTGLSLGILKLANAATDLGSQIHDLSMKTNFSAETLSSLKVAAELSGGSLAGLGTALGIFDRNMEEARQGSEEMSRVFKALKLDTEDNEKAFRQAFQVLTTLGGGATQTAVAMKLFGRSGKDVLGIIKETGGDLDKFTEKMREAGFVITQDGAKKADEFGDQLTLLRNEFDAVIRQIGMELVPLVSQAASDISRWLRQNQGELRKTAQEVAALLGELYTLAKFAATPIVVQVILTRQIVDITKEALSTGARAVRQLDQRFGSSANAPVNPTLSPGFLAGRLGLPVPPPPRTNPLLPSNQPAIRSGRVGFDFESTRIKREQEASAKAIRDALAAPRGRGGGGGDRARRPERDEAVELLKRLQEEFQKLTAVTTDEKLAVELGAEAYQKLNEAMKVRLRDAFELNEQQKKYNDAEKDFRAFIESQKEQLKALTSVEAGHITKVEEQIAALEKLGVTIEENLKKDARDNAQKLRKEESLQQLNAALASYDESLVSNANGIQRLTELYEPYLKVMDEAVKLNQQMVVASDFAAKIDQALGGEKPPSIQLLGGTQKQFEEFQAKINEWATGLTWTLDQAIYDGLTQGAGRGFASLGIGLLDLLRNHFLKQLHESLVEMLSSVFSRTGSSKGGLLSTIFGLVAGAFAGGSVGGGSAGGAGGFGGSFVGFAEGGFMAPHSFGLVGERGPEIVKAGPTGTTVTPIRTAPNVTFIVYANDAQSFTSRETQAQITRRYRQLMQREAFS